MAPAAAFDQLLRELARFSRYLAADHRPLKISLDEIQTRVVNVTTYSEYHGENAA